MLSFRKKILFSDLILLLILIALLFPFVEKTVGNIVQRSLEERASELIDEIKTAPTLPSMIQRLKAQELLVFFRVSLIDERGRVLYDSHVQKLLKDQYSPYYLNSHPEVEEAFKYGIGYSEGYSQLFSQTFAYVAKSFRFEGKKYVLRTAFPFKQIEELTKDFEIGFLSLGAVILLLYSFMTWAIIHQLSRPIQHIITAIKPYQEGKEEFLPRIEMHKSIDPNDDFGRLAHTLNFLSEKIQKQIQTLTEERNENEAILESLVEGVVAVDSNNVVTYANFMACKMLGTPKYSMKGRPFETLKERPNSELVTVCKELLVLCQQKSEILKEPITIGEIRKVFLDIIAAPKAHKSGAILVLQDKTSEYKVLQMGKDFVANASHELRTPITIIRGFAETLLDLPDLSPEMLQEITGKIVKTCHRLNSLVKNLLTLADIENLPEERFEECDIETVIENCKLILEAMHKDVVVNIEKKTGIVSIEADVDLLELAINNLLENAVKYSNPPAHITIIQEQVEDEIKIIIKDKGIGIPPENVDHVFARFYTVDKARSRKFGGAGLGLSIVKTIIEKHNGEIKASSVLGEGTSFTITLPIIHKTREKIEVIETTPSAE